MERSTPVRNPHTSTADLLTWSENPPEYPRATASSARSHQPSDGISMVLGGQVTDDEVESLNRRKQCLGHKMKEMAGSGIFTANGASEIEDDSQTPVNRTGLRAYQEQALAGGSHFSFGEEETVSPKKPATLHEVTKQRELSGNQETEPDANSKKQFSVAKNKELSGHDVFAQSPELQPRPLAARALALRESITIGEPKSHNGAGGQINGPSIEESTIKTSKNVSNQKSSEIPGNDIFKGDEHHASAEKPLSSAKLREMSGSNIFGDGKVESRDYLGGVRKPPGGGSSISLV